MTRCLTSSEGSALSIDFSNTTLKACKIEKIKKNVDVESSTKYLFLHQNRVKKVFFVRYEYVLKFLKSAFKGHEEIKRSSSSNHKTT